MTACSESETNLWKKKMLVWKKPHIIIKILLNLKRLNPRLCCLTVCYFNVPNATRIFCSSMVSFMNSDPSLQWPVSQKIGHQDVTSADLERRSACNLWSLMQRWQLDGRQQRSPSPKKCCQKGNDEEHLINMHSKQTVAKNQSSYTLSRCNINLHSPPNHQIVTTVVQPIS